MPAPEDEEVLRVTTLISARVQSMIERRALEQAPDMLAESDLVWHRFMRHRCAAGLRWARRPENGWPDLATGSMATVWRRFRVHAVLEFRDSIYMRM